MVFNIIQVLHVQYFTSTYVYTASHHQNLVSILHRIVDPLYPFYPPPTPSPLVTTTQFSVSIIVNILYDHNTIITLKTVKYTNKFS